MIRRFDLPPSPLPIWEGESMSPSPNGVKPSPLQGFRVKPLALQGFKVKASPLPEEKSPTSPLQGGSRGV
jgi:hypothetical protein